MAPIKKTKKEEPQVSTNDLLKMIAGDIKGALTMDEKVEIKYTQARMTSYARASVYGGYPAGAIYEIHGPNAGGKTASGIEILASAQEAGHLTSFFDHERAANDKKWIAALGLDLNNCIYRNSHADGKSIWTLEDAAEEVNTMIHNFYDAKRKKAIPEEKLLYILWDSVAAAVPSAKVAKNAKVGDANYGLTARLMSDWLQTLTALLGNDVAIIFLNQERVNVGAKPWDPKFKSFGGDALQFYAHMRIRVSHAGEIKEKVNGEEIIVGRKHRIKIEKNKYGYPSQEAMFYTSNGLGESDLGFDDVRTTLDEAIFQGIIYKANTSWFASDYFDGNINGERKVRDFLKDNPPVLENIKYAIHQMIKEGRAKLTADEIQTTEEEA
jgi:recombination protein RecA